MFKKYSNVKFHENPSSESRVVPWGRTDGHTDVQECHFFAILRNAPKNQDIKACKKIKTTKTLKKKSELPLSDLFKNIFRNL